MQELPAIIPSSSLPRRVKDKLLKEGIIRKLIPKIYTSNIDDDLDIIVKKNWSQLIAASFPGAVLSHRSAFEFGISPKKNIYLTHKSRKVVKWPGLTIRMVRGQEHQQDDNPLIEGLYVASLERACLENLSKSRTSGDEKRVLKQALIEERLIQELNTRGEVGLNKIRDRAKILSETLDLETSFKTLNKIISSILSTHPSDILTSPIALAKSIGEPYDVGRIELFTDLVGALRANSFESRTIKDKSTKSFENFAFFEAYFSNYIEGTTFEIEEAEDIIYKQLEIPNRTGDTHDIRSTFAICSDRVEMAKVPLDADDFINILRRRHAVILQGRPEKRPGEFKSNGNRAGDTHFVKPKHVIGTLKQGHQLINALQEPLSRAIYMMFLVSEIHPFDDGNGRIARVMMNAELVTLKESKIIVPTVYRDDYLLNLRKLTRQQDASGFIRMMDRIHAFSDQLENSDFNTLKSQLIASNAFKESDEAAIIFT